MESTLTLALTLKLLLLLLAANGSPVIAKRIFGERCAYPVDGGLIFFDGQPLLGKSKTVRGILAGVVVTALIAPVLGLSWVTGAFFGLASLGGDALSSFVKRRLSISPSGKALGLDQIPEALLPLWLLHETLGLDLWSVLALVALFIVSELLLSRVMFWLGIRDHPY